VNRRPSCRPSGGSGGEGGRMLAHPAKRVVIRQDALSKRRGMAGWARSSVEPLPRIESSRHFYPSKGRALVPGASPGRCLLPTDGELCP
jgi:hypothetical protein